MAIRRSGRKMRTAVQDLVRGNNLIKVLKKDHKVRCELEVAEVKFQCLNCSTVIIS